MNRLLSRRFLASDTALLIFLAAATLLIHLVTIRQYGYFRDEFYYVACGEHLDWGAVDHPPFVDLVALLARRTLGDSLFALRLLPALSGALLVFLSGLLARELGGGRFAQALSAVTVMAAPVYLGTAGNLSMNCFDHLFWLLAALLVVRILRDDRPRLWLLFGLVAGMGLLNKYSMGFFGMGLAVGLILTPARRHLRNPWLWLGGALALVLFLPHVVWEIRHGFPTREFIRNATLYKNAPMSPLAFLKECVLGVNPVSLPVWLAGLGWYFFREEGKRFRILGWIFLATLGLFLTTNAKPYYLAPAFLLLFPAGGVAVETFIRSVNWSWLKPAYLTLVAAGGAALAPFAIGCLPVETFIRYQASLGVAPHTEERTRLAELPQMYADMFGWENMVATVAKVYGSLTPEERARTLIFCSNYGEAGAIDFFGWKYGLPKASSGHNTYWFWGATNPSADMVITVGVSPEDVGKTFERVDLAATIVSPHARPLENNVPVYIGREPKRPLKEVWPSTKGFI